MQARAFDDEQVAQKNTLEQFTLSKRTDNVFVRRNIVLNYIIRDVKRAKLQTVHHHSHAQTFYTHT